VFQRDIFDLFLKPIGDFLAGTDLGDAPVDRFDLGGGSFIVLSLSMPSYPGSTIFWSVPRI